MRLGILAQDHRREVLDRADHGARLPFQRGLAPAMQSRLIGFNLNEHPVAHLGVDDDGFDGGDFHRSAKWQVAGGKCRWMAGGRFFAASDRHLPLALTCNFLTP